MTISKNKAIDTVFTAFILLYPILPIFFVIAGLPVYTILAVIVFLISILNGVSTHKIKYFFMCFSPVIILAVVSYGYHGDFYSMINNILLTMIIPIFVILIYVNSYEKFIKIIKITAAAGVILCVSSILERFFGFNIFSLIETTDLGPMGSSPYYRNGLRVEQSFSTAISFGIYLLAITTLLVILVKEKKITNKKWYFFCFVLIFIAMYFTESRMPLITLFVLYIIYFFKFDFKKKIIVLFLLVAVLFIDYLLGGYICNYLIDYIELIIHQFSGENTELGYDTSSAYRINLWSILWPYIKQKPFFGYGNQFMSNFTFEVWDHSHYSIDNGYLSNIMSHGIIGLMAILMPSFLGIYFSIKMMRRHDKKGYYFFALYIVYFINVLSVAMMTEKRIFYVVLALQMSYEYLWRTQQRGDHQIVKNRLNGGAH